MIAIRQDFVPPHISTSTDREDNVWQNETDDRVIRLIKERDKLYGKGREYTSRILFYGIIICYFLALTACYLLLGWGKDTTFAGIITAMFLAGIMLVYNLVKFIKNENIFNSCSDKLYKARQKQHLTTCPSQTQRISN